MSVLLTPSDRIAGARRVHRDRGGVRSQEDTAYLAYLIVLVLAMVVVPLLIGIARTLSEPEILTALRSPASERVVLAVGSLLLAGAAALGTHRGPAHLPPVLVATLAATDLPRSRTLLRPFVTAALALTGLCVVAGGLVATVLVTEGLTVASLPAGAELRRALSFTAAAAFFGVLAAAAWLAGQRIGPRRGWVLTAALLAATALTLLVPPLALITPWGWLADVWPATTSGAPWALLPLALAALIGAACAPRLLGQISGPHLLEQARQWEVVGTAAYTGDFASALAAFRARPHRGRRWRAVRHVPEPMQYVVRDLIGAARTPLRVLTGLAFLILGGLVTALSAAHTPMPPWLLVSVGAIITFAALGTLTDGFRHAAETQFAPPLFGQSTGRLYALHALLPTVVSVLCAVIGAGLARQAGWTFAGAVEAALLGLLLVAVRAFDSAKGPLPLALLTPAPSPVGDMSGLMVLAWQADALILSVALGVGLTLVTASAGLVLATGAALLGVAAVAGLTYARLTNF